MSLIDFNNVLTFKVLILIQAMRIETKKKLKFLQIR